MIDREEHSYAGAFYGRAICETCRSSVGNTWLEDIHNGYESSHGKELTDQQKKCIYNSAKKHDKQHPKHQIRILFGHGTRQP
jgi:hypothetical protein